MSDKTHLDKVLLVEDDPDIASLTKQTLLKEGYQVCWVATATEGFEELTKGPYTFLIVDYALPDMTGLTLFKKVKKDYPHLVILMVTGSGDEQTAAAALRGGIDDYLIKGVNQEHLSILPLVMERALERRRLQQAEKELQEQLREEAALLEKKVQERTQKLQQTCQELEKSQEATFNIMQDLDLKRKEAEGREQLLKETQAMLVQAEKLSGLGQLSAGVAHELNSPLAGILELLRGFLRRTDKTSRDYKLFEAMKRATEHAAKIVKDLNTFARAPSGEMEEVNVNTLLENIFSFMEKEMRGRGVSITKKFADDIKTVSAEGAQLQQVFLNLMTNACDAMDKVPKEKKELVIETKNRGSHVEISFTDKGEGIADDIKGKIFDPFFTTKAIGKGTGLGLSISHSIIAGHGGAITVISGVDKGSTFTVSLPSKLVPKEKF